MLAISLISFIASIISIVLNILLVYILNRKAKKVVGIYRHMMVATAAYDAIFSAILIIATPVSWSDSRL